MKAEGGELIRIVPILKLRFNRPLQMLRPKLAKALWAD
jgi:hypothetical protein